MSSLLPPPPAQEPAMFDRGTRGQFLRTLSPQNSGTLSFPTVNHIDKRTPKE